MYFGDTAEERLLDMKRRGNIGPAEGEPGLTRVESCINNGVQVRGTVTSRDVAVGATLNGAVEGGWLTCLSR